VSVDCVERDQRGGEKEKIEKVRKMLEMVIK
jgi:hypothetical protein